MFIASICHIPAFLRASCNHLAMSLLLLGDLCRPCCNQAKMLRVWAKLASPESHSIDTQPSQTHCNSCSEWQQRALQQWKVSSATVSRECPGSRACVADVSKHILTVEMEKPLIILFMRPTTTRWTFTSQCSLVSLYLNHIKPSCFSSL